MSLSCTVDETLSCVSKIEGGHVAYHTSLSGVMMRALVVLLCINQHTKFEVPSFTNYKDMIEAKFKKNESCDPEHAH